MSWKPFASVGDYPTMLNKIATFNFGASILAIMLIRSQIQAVEDALAPFNITVPVLGIPLPLGTILPAFGVAFLSRALKLHDRLSDLFRIRQRFDVVAILLPLAAATGGIANAGVVRKIKTKREDLMYATFYKYASSTPGKAVIDSHYITMALDQWTWYWILLEAATLATLCALALFVAGQYWIAALLLMGVLAAAWLLQFIRYYCAEYALQQVEQILSDPARQQAIGAEFSAL